MADWGNYVIQGGLTKYAPDMSTDPNWKILAYFVFPPKAGSYHVIDPPQSMFDVGLVADDVLLPTNHRDLLWKKPDDDFPDGDWSMGSKVYMLYEDELTGLKYKVTFSLVGYKTLISAGRNPLGKGFIALVLGSFNVATFGLFSNNMGGWLVTEIAESGGTSLGNPSFSPDVNSDTFRPLYQDQLDENRNKQVITWLGVGLLTFGIVKKSAVMAVSGAALVLKNSIKK